MPFESFQSFHCALLSAANQSEEDAAISTAIAPMTDCWDAIARPAADAQEDWNLRGHRVTQEQPPAAESAM